MLHARHKQLTFWWVPSHVGIHGNELADRAASHAATHNTICRRHIPDVIQLGHLPANDFYSQLKQGFFNCWQECWSDDRRGAKLRSIKPLLGKWSSSCRKSRHQEVVLARLRIGHTNVTHSYLMAKEDPLCALNAVPRVHSRSTTSSSIVRLLLLLETGFSPI